MEHRIRLAVIGGGPGGYVAAIRAAQLGMEVTLIEKDKVGGTCLNRGCIPTKALMHSSHLYSIIGNLDDIGITVENSKLDYGKVLDRKDTIISKMEQGIEGLLKANQVKRVKGKATIHQKIVISQSSFVIDINGCEDSDEVTELEVDKVLIATGANPIRPKIEGANLTGVVSSDELLTTIRKLPERLLIIGGGVIGIEFATLYREFGCQVEVIESMDRILSSLDKEISQSISMVLKKKGVQIHSKSTVHSITEVEDGTLTIAYEEKSMEKETTASLVLMAVGRKANLSCLEASDLNLQMEGSCIYVNDNFESSVEGIYAIGDVTPGMQLAHRASAQGIFAVERMIEKEIGSSKENPKFLSVIPSCIYTSPEVAVVGLDEDGAKAAGYDIIIGKYPMHGNGKTLISNGERGYIKVICEKGTNQILGAQILCDRATDIISEFSLAMVSGITYDQMATIVRPHPTYEEGVTDALFDVEGLGIHLMPKSKR